MGKPFPLSLYEVSAGAPRTHQKLQIVPLFGPETGPPVNALHHALKNEEALVSEVSEGGIQQPELVGTQRNPGSAQGTQQAPGGLGNQKCLYVA